MYMCKYVNIHICKYVYMQICIYLYKAEIGRPRMKILDWVKKAMRVSTVEDLADLAKWNKKTALISPTA